MKILILWILFSWVISMGPESYNGMMVSYTKTGLNNDIFYLFEIMMKNLRVFNFKDLKEEEEYGNLKNGRYITNIEIVKTTLERQDLYDNVNYDQESYIYSLSSKKKIINSIVKFNWRIMALNIDVAYGVGYATISSSDFGIKVVMPRPSSESIDGKVTTTLDFSVSKLNGLGANNEIKTWINKKLNDISAKEFENAIGTNEVISKYLVSNYKKVETTRCGHHIKYEHTPKLTIEYDNLMWILFSTKIFFDNNDPIYIEGSSFSKVSPRKSEISIYLSSNILKENIKHLKNDCKLHLSIDTKNLGYSGTVNEFIGAMPELALKVDKSSPLRINCSSSEISINTKNSSDVKLRCDYNSKDQFLVNSDTQMEMKMVPSVLNDIYKSYTTKIKESKLNSVSTRPSIMDVSLLVSQIILAYQKEDILDQGLDIPGIHYESLRKNYKIEAEATDDYYVACYTYDR